MMREAVTQFPVPWLMGVALGLFLIAMMVLMAKTFNRRQTNHHRRMASLPLSED